MNRKIIIATWPNGYFGSAPQSWETLNVGEIRSLIQESLNATTEIRHVDKLGQLNSSDIVIYCSSENMAFHNFIRDHIYIASQKANIIPHFDHLMAYENKGFQQLYRIEKGFGDLNGDYHIEENTVVTKAAPFVFKPITGAGSNGVKLIKNESNKKHLKKFFSEKSILRRTITFVRKLQLTQHEFDLYQYAKRNFKPAVTQDFIPGLDGDYKIIISGDRFYGIKRFTKKNDFRASGSGLLEYDQAPDSVLDYADKIFNLLDAPYVSLDIALSHGKCHLIEYQILNFGPKGIINSTGFFKRNEQKWVFQPFKSNLEETIAYGLIFHIKSKHQEFI